MDETTMTDRAGCHIYTFMDDPRLSIVKAPYFFYLVLSRVVVT